MVLNSGILDDLSFEDVERAVALESKPQEEDVADSPRFEARMCEIDKSRTCNDSCLAFGFCPFKSDEVENGDTDLHKEPEGVIEKEVDKPQFQEDRDRQENIPSYNFDPIGKEENYYLWLKQNGFLEKVITMYRTYGDGDELLFQIEEESELRDYVHEKMKTVSPTNRKNFYKYYLEYYLKMYRDQ